MPGSASGSSPGPYALKGRQIVYGEAVLVVQRAAVDLAGELREAVGRPRRRALAHVLLGGRELGRAARTPSTTTRTGAARPAPRAPRGRPSCRAPWFTSSSVCGSLWKFAMPPTIAARWITCVQPDIARRAPRRPARRSPRWISQPRAIQSGASRWSDTRTSQSPSRSRRLTTAAPIVPAPPVTRTRVTRPGLARARRRTPSPTPVTFHGSTSSVPSGSRSSRPSKAEWFVATTTASAPSSADVERLRLGGHVRVVARHVGQLALEQADELVGERVAHVVGVALEGEAEHGDLAVAQRAAEPRLQPLDEEQRHRLVHARDGQQHAGRARALLGEGEVLAQAGARGQPRRRHPAARVVVVDQARSRRTRSRRTARTPSSAGSGSANCV